MEDFVQVSFDCLPLRSIGRLDIPIDASPKFRARCERIKDVIAKHGTHNAYYLYDAHCVFHLTNDPDRGMLDFGFDGVLLTDAEDQKACSCDLRVQLEKETCDWLTEPVVHWFGKSVSEAVIVEFDRYIAAGDLEKTKQRVVRVQAECDESSGFLGMYL